MFGVNDLPITLYFVGEDKDDAQEGLVFDLLDSAQEHARENGFKVFEAEGLIDFTTMTEVK